MHIVPILPNESREFVVCRTFPEPRACASLSRHAQYVFLEFICLNESLFKVLTHRQVDVSEDDTEVVQVT